MVQLGKVYQNLMVDLKASNVKLNRPRTADRDGSHPVAAPFRRRASCSAGGEVKLALAMHLYGLDKPAAKKRLDECSGKLAAGGV